MTNCSRELGVGAGWGSFQSAVSPRLRAWQGGLSFHGLGSGRVTEWFGSFCPTPHPRGTLHRRGRTQTLSAVPATLPPWKRVLADHACAELPWAPTDREHKSAFYILGNAGLARSQGTSLQHQIKGLAPCGTPQPLIPV